MAIEKTKPITQKDVTKWEDLIKKADKAGEKILNRLDYIIRFCCDLWDTEIDFWNFNTIDDDELETPEKMPTWLDIDPSSTETIDMPSIYDGTRWARTYEWMVLDDEGNEVSLESFPTRWLYEDFEDELRKAKQDYDGDTEFLDKEREAAKERIRAVMQGKK